MTPNHEYFTAEQVDEQIEQLRQRNTPPGQATEEQLVNVLQRHYRVCLVAEDRATLAHARQRLLDRLSDEDIRDREQQFVNGREALPATPPRPVRRVRFLSSLAAVLVVGALLGSWLVVIHLALTPPPASGARQGSLYTIHSGIVYRLDGNTGKVIWQHPVPTKKQSDPNHGGSASLQVMNSVVYAVLDFDIYALDARNGQQIWHITNQRTAEYFSFVVDHERLYLFSVDGTFSALDAANGTPVWHNTTFTTQNGYGFRVLNGDLYTEASSLTPGKQKLTVLEGATGKVRWSSPLLDGSLHDPPLVANGVVYFSSGAILSAVKEQNGDKIWEKHVSVGGGLEILSLVNDVLYINGGTAPGFGNTHQAMYAVAARTGQMLWTSDPDFSAFHLPMTGGLLLAWRQHNGTYSIAGLDPRSGKVNWQVPFSCHAATRDPENPQVLNPSCGVSWSEVINGTWYLLESESQLQNGGQGFQVVYTLKRFDPRTGHLLSAHPFGSGQDNLGVIGTTNGLLYVTLGVPRTANTIPYTDIIFGAYHLNDATQAWRYVMPPFPTPQGANTSPDTSGAVVVSDNDV